MKPTYEQLEKELELTKAALSRTNELLKKALEKISELEEKIKLNSKNSSKPPSSDKKPNTPPKAKKPKQSRLGFSKAMFPPDKISKFIECSCKDCEFCGSSDIFEVDIPPKILQQIELPEVKAIITEYLRKKYKCSTCGNQSIGQLPEGIPDSAFGPKVMALFTTLTGVFHLAKREAIQLIKDLYDIEVSLGSSSNIEERVANAIDPIYEKIHNLIINGNLCKHFDETSWRTDGKRRYVWVASCSEAACYNIDPSRSRAAFEKFLGFPSSNLEKATTDRYSVYNTISKFHQYCLAHLIRDFQRFAEKESDDKTIGEALAKDLAKACQIHREFREDNITKKQRNIRLGHLKRKIKESFFDGLANGSDKLAAICENLLNDFDNLWAFTKVDGMEPTNNTAERDMRKIVIWRKKSFGTRSLRGEKFVERITSIAETLKRQKKNILSFLEAAIASFYGKGKLPEISTALGI